VYFLAKGALTQGANVEGHEPREGAENLYAYERDGEQPAGRLSFVATLSSGDAQQWESGFAIANVTPDGRYLVFTSHAALTPDATRAGPAQVYRYDARGGRLLRVSVGAQGFNDNGNAAGAGNASIPAAQSSYEGRGASASTNPTMSDDGSYVFFQSPVALVPGALDNRPVTGNAHVLAQNVYEWEAPGNGGCEQPGGCVSLISDGRDLSEGHRASSVHLIGTDATGQNVFFETTDQLVPGDTDTQVDYYDARVGGGFPAPAAPAPCEGQACRETSGVSSPFGTISSQAFTGVGNFAPLPPTPPPKSLAKGLTRQQKLAKALLACHKRYRAGRTGKLRSACERAARKRYGPRRKPPSPPGKRSHAVGSHTGSKR
jgi:hypothetical protein